MNKDVIARPGSSQRRIVWAAACLSGLLLAGCTTLEPAAPEPAPAPVVPAPAPEVPPPPPLPPPPDPRVLELDEAVQLYDNGEFAAAIKLLQPLGADEALEAEHRLKALKTLAFAQCSSRALTACRQSFERAFRLDREFDLLPTERGHPLWGPQFMRARKNVTGR